jgi:Phage integrase, N-terminal SAM-like domain
VKHYSIRTEQAYVDWIRRYILFHRKRHPNEMGEKEITDFLTHLAVEKSVAASTQNQAFAALLFLYQQVLDRKLDFIDKVERVTRPAKLPVVFTPNEARSVLAYLKGDYRLMAELLYGSGLRHSFRRFSVSLHLDCGGAGRPGWTGAHIRCESLQLDQSLWQRIAPAVDDFSLFHHRHADSGRDHLPWTASDDAGAAT